ncbi:MAG TPA: hypothetical protein VE549_04825 [Myxococcaceae bacterium]|nr:hypothetical protein [Myxococcaceae bacterium]
MIDAIDSTEPYRSGKGHALWQLNEVNKPDKHKLPLAAISIHGGVDIMPTLEAHASKTIGGNPKLAPLLEGFRKLKVYLGRDTKRPLRVGDEVFVESLDHEIRRDRTFIFEVSLDAPGVIEYEPALKTFRDLANAVEGAVTKLGRFLH